ncbi:hypothetical protein RSAG8_10753, partial [Rhizoctonia solani AG-8 WAC10335]
MVLASISVPTYVILSLFPRHTTKSTTLDGKTHVFHVSGASTGILVAKHKMSPGPAWLRSYLD